MPQTATCFSIASSVNPRYSCYWLDSCCGQHELMKCLRWENELCGSGRKGIYYSSDGSYKHFNHGSLSYNPTGCTTVHLLIYRFRPHGEKEVLFGLSHRRNTPDEATRHPLLSFLCSKPRKRGEYGKPIA